MAKKRKRTESSATSSVEKAAAAGDSVFAWKKVDVGLLAPSRASTHSHSNEADDEDFDSGKNHYDSPTSKIYRSAERDLEADPAEGVGMFLGLEVLDGSQYSVIEDGGYKRLVPKTPGTKNDNDGQPTKKKSASKAKDVPESKAKEPNSSEGDAEKTKRKKKKKKRKKNKKGGDAEVSSGNDNNEPTPASQKDGATKELITEGKPQDHTAGEDNKEEAEPDPQVEALQNSWMTATGGVTLANTLCKSLLAQNWWSPTPIQAASLPAAILGRRNIVGAAPTGSGKTLAYLLPIFEYLLQQEEPSYEDRKIQALILAPTRELAMQVQGECDKLIKGQCCMLVGGMSEQKQERVLRTKKPPIIIATPGRLWELISSRQHDHLNDLSRITFLVIDECDRMTEQGSFPQLHSILDAVERANPMDEDDEDSDADEEDEDGDDDDDEARLRSLPGVRGESKVVMLNDDVLAMIERQRNGEAEPPKPVETDDDDDDDIIVDDEELVVEEDEEVLNTARRPVYRQTFVYSATLTLPPSASYIPSRNKRKKMFNLKGLQGAIEEILDKARARGQTKLIDLSNSKKQAKFNEKILESKDKSKKDPKKGELTPKRSFNLPPGLKLQEIKCTQMHKDSHLYAYLVTTREGAAGPCLVFCNSIKAVRRVGQTLKLLGLPVRVLHASMQQRARFRSVESLQSGSRAVVVATDVAARGLDIPNVASVVHYDVARKVDGFVHRAGRTARGMGKTAVGSSVSLISPDEDKAHRKIVSELSAVFYNVPLDSRLLSAAQERANLASKIVAAEKIEGKAKQTNDWFLKNAEEAGLEVDEEALEDGLSGGDLKERQQLLEAQRAKGQLQRLLAEPMVTQRYGKFLSVNTAAKKPDVAPYVVKAASQGKRSKKRKKSK